MLNIFGSNICSDNINPILANTRVLNLSNSKIDDLSPIAGFLQVRSLWLDNNDVDNLEPLSSMQNLMFLSLNNNFISNPTSLKELKNLQWVFLNENQITKIDFIHYLKNLKFLGLNGNLINDPTPFYDASPSTYILAHRNPFTKTYCHKNSRSTLHPHVLKACADEDNNVPAIENSLKPAVDHHSSKVKKLQYSFNSSEI